MSQLNTTELDFDVIKNNLISYFKRSDGPFKDWNFAGAGLNHLVDLLAYNTHYNALLAHTSLNEAYLDSAQVRANVVSHAKALGYTPRSKNAAVATVNLTFNKSDATSSAGYTLPSGTKFSAVVGTKTHKFITVDDTVGEDTGTQFKFNNIQLKQATRRTQTFITNSVEGQEQRYVIQNKDIDTSDLDVLVYDSLTASSYSVYTKFSGLAEINSQSQVYYLNENAEGRYEISFGNNVFGKQPTASSRVEVTYSVTNGAQANGANNFVYTDTSTAVEISSVVTVSSAAGGADQENKASIKFNAPLTFTAQDRAVTTSDYKALVKSEIPGIEDILAWGGEENDIVNYGSVYLCAKPTGQNNLTTAQKERIQTFLQNKKMIGTRIEIVDATFTYLQFDISFAYDKNETLLNVGELSSKILSGVRRYNNVYLNYFTANYRHSKFLRELDNVDSAILGTNAAVTAYKEASIIANTNNNIELDFAFPLLGAVDQTASIISTSIKYEQGSGTRFTELFNGQTYDVELKDRAIPGSADTRQIYSVLVDQAAGDQEVVINNNVGTLKPSTGIIEIQNFVGGTNTKIRVSVTPLNFDVKTQRRNLLQIDDVRTTISGSTDRSSFNGQTYTGSVGVADATAPETGTYP